MQGASAARNVAKAPSKLPGEAKAASDLTLDPPFCVSLPVLINPLPPPRLPAPESSTPPNIARRYGTARDHPASSLE